MIKAIDIDAELASCTFFEGRTRLSDTPDTFACMAEYRDGAIIQRLRNSFLQVQGARKEG